MPSKRKKPIALSVGQQLKTAREEQKQAHSDIAADTKVQPWVLEALEDDRLHELMSPIYVKGFLVTYARFLHLDADGLIAQLPIPQPKHELHAELPKSRHIRIRFRIPAVPLPQVRRVALSISVIALFGGLIMLNPLRWITNLTLPQGITAKLATFSPVSEKPHPLEISKIDLAPGEQLKLTIIADRATWVQIKADGKLLTQYRLPRGSKEHWIANRKFDIVIAEPSQIQISLNGESIHPHAISYHGKLHISRSGITLLSNDKF